MPIYVSQEPRKEKKKGGGLSILGSLLGLAGAVAGQPWLAVAGAGMSAADTIARGADPMQTVSMLTQFVGAAQKMQQQKASQSELQQIMATAPQDRAAMIAGTETPTQSALASAGGLMRSSGEITSGLADMGPSPMRSKLQLGMLEQSLEPEKSPFPGLDKEKWPEAAGRKYLGEGEVPDIQKPPDIETVWGLMDICSPKEVVGGKTVARVPKVGPERNEFFRKFHYAVRYDHWDEKIQRIIDEQLAAYLGLDIGVRGKPGGISKSGKGKRVLTDKQMMSKLAEYGGDKERVRKWARKNGYIIPGK